MKLTVVYDNREFSPGWETGWGFSCLFENEKEKLLFDTGDNSKKLLFNIEKAKIDINSINALTFSHNHWDHVDGAEGFLKRNKTAKVYIPSNFPEKFSDMVKYYGHDCEKINGKVKLISGVYSTPVLKGTSGPDEQGVIADGEKGYALITGCAHPGILNMTKQAGRIFGEPIKMILGGFHLRSVSENDILKLISKLEQAGVEIFCPCHCTGGMQIEVFSKNCGKQFMKIGSGKIINW